MGKGIGKHWALTRSLLVATFLCADKLRKQFQKLDQGLDTDSGAKPLDTLIVLPDFF